MPIFVIAGQSNAEFSGIDNRIYELAAVHGTGFDIVKVALRNTSLFPDPARTDWAPSSGELYADLVAAVRAAAQRIRDAGDTPVVTTLWVQGESDVPRGAAYEAELEAFITRYRADIGQPDSLFAISLLPYAGAVRTAQLAVAADLGHVITIETSGAGTWDGIHYDRATRIAIATAFMESAGVPVPSGANWQTTLGQATIVERPYAVSVIAPQFADFTWSTPEQTLPVYVASYSGDDRIVTGAGDDVVNTGGNNDIVRTGAGNDVIVLGMDNDFANGGEGNDQIIGDSGTDRLYGAAGNDILDGGQNTDLVDGGTGRDTASYARAQAGVKVDLRITTYQDTGADGRDKLVSIENLAGTRFADRLIGNDSANRIDSGAGDDRLQGGGGADTLTGGIGADVLAGGAGADRFVFLGTADSPADAPDTIVAFSPGAGDRIVLSRIDANAGTARNDAFKFIGEAAFGAHAGELRFTRSEAGTLVEADVDGDAHADFAIALDRQVMLGAADFVL